MLKQNDKHGISYNACCPVQKEIIIDVIWSIYLLPFSLYHLQYSIRRFLKMKEKGDELTSKGSVERSFPLSQLIDHNAFDMERKATGAPILYQPDEILSVQVKQGVVGTLE